MLQILGIVESTIFFILAGIHFYWALGGNWGFENALPTDEEGKRVLNPRKFDSSIVGFGLLAYAFYFLIKIDLIALYLPKWFLSYGGFIIALILIFRAIGDFKYLGLFKKVTNTAFAKYDTNYYSPLCLFLGVVAILLQIL